MARAEQQGISSADLVLLKNKKLATYGAFAFLCPYNSQAQDLRPLQVCLTRVLGAEPDDDIMPVWRRIQFEAHTHVLSDARSTVERTESAEPRKVPMQEKVARLDDLRIRLTHLIIGPELEPSHALIDVISQILDDGIVKYVSLEQCTSRRQEMLSIKKEPSVRLDATGIMKIVQRTSMDTCDLSSDLSIRTAFQRRGLALDMCRMMTYIEHEKWVSHLFSHLFLAPPPGYSAVTMDQLLSADREMWTVLAEKCRRGLKLDASGKFPFEEELKLLFYSPTVAYMLLPLPTGSPNQRKRKGDGGKGDGEKADKKKQKGEGKGKGSGKKKEGKGKQGSAAADLKPGATFEQIPDLKGCWIKVRGEVVCPKYNLGSCPEDKDVKPGDSCSRGKHVCCFPRCFDKHRWSDFHKK